MTEGGQPRSVTILGVTGSIGQSTADLITRAPACFRVEAVTAYGNAEALAREARRLGARLAVVGNPEAYERLRDALAGSGIQAAAGEQAVVEAAGLAPTLAAARRGAIIALANKETLVCAGALVKAEVRRSGATLLPVDSEHSAIFQVFDQRHPETVERIVLTASGGPFRTATEAEMERAGPEQAVAHPNWSMGAKISVDSATMMNKGLELIEAHHLFDMPPERMDVLVHPQSVVHSLVDFIDGSVLAQMGEPDMRTPIAYALAWPTRMASPVTRLDLAAWGSLTFEAPDPARFPALDLARRALQSGGAAPTILNAANEVAVSRFLAGEIPFPGIGRITEAVLARQPAAAPEDLDDVLAVDREARRLAAEAPA